MRYFVSIISILLVFSCQDVKRPEKPDNLIPKNKMVEIYSDAYLMNAARSINLKVLTEHGVYLDSLLYEKYDIDSVQFVKSNAYYTADLNTYLALFEEVQQRLVVLQKVKDSTNISEVIKAEAQLIEDSTNVDSGLINPVKSDSI